MTIVSRPLEALCIAVAIMVIGIALPLSSPTKPAAAAALSQGGPAQGCVVDSSQRVSPAVLVLGEHFETQLVVSARCLISSSLHIVFVLDASGSMAGPNADAMKSSVKQLIRGLNMESNPDTKVGVVEFNSAARTLCQLTNSVGRATRCVDKVGARGGTAIDKGVSEAAKVIRRGRSRLGGRSAFEALVVLTDGASNNGCEPVKQYTRIAKDEGMLVATICLGGGCDSACMREAASEARFFYEAAKANQLAQVFNRIGDEIPTIGLRALEVPHTIPDNMEYVVESEEPRAELSEDKKTLTWRYAFVPKEGLTFTFLVRPLEPGSHPTNTEALIRYRDRANNSGESRFRKRLVAVFGNPPRP